jgi:predicted transposase/invertase (TIGR01784 family)
MMEQNNGDPAMKARYVNPYSGFGFKKLFGEEASAEIANFTPHQLSEYEESLKIYRDLKGVIDTSYEEGLQEGREEGEKIGEEKGIKKGKIEMARAMKKSREPTAKIALYTGLSTDEINRL